MPVAVLLFLGQIFPVYRLRVNREFLSESPTGLHNV